MSQTVSKPTPYERTFQMSVLGLIVAIGTALVLLPLAPVVLALWLLYRLFGTGDQET